jgi:hypothetical protein
MQLEEDLEYRVPTVSTAVRHSPFVVPVSLEEEETLETENCLEIP